VVVLEAGLERNGEAGAAKTEIVAEEVQLRDYRGKSVVLNFWATW